MTHAEIHAHLLSRIPPGFRECTHQEYANAHPLNSFKVVIGDERNIYAIRKPKPEPRRVEVGGDVEFDRGGAVLTASFLPRDIRTQVGGGEAVAGTRWKYIAICEEVTE